MIFTSDGSFEDEIDFNNDAAQAAGRDGHASTSVREKMAQLREQKKAAPARAASKRTNLNPVLDFKGNVYVM